ncbi:MAG: DUF2461 domain-containing protein [Planctomycetota bacterium]|nr:DUF2461 domain-containing protein [Planctomycetota bacterium]
MFFSQKSLHFLDENHRRNDREWFFEHKDEFEKYVRRPMLDLARDLIPTMLDIDPLLNVDPKRAVCRIYRDCRRMTRNKTMFKRALWWVFQRSKGMTHPVWFFEFTPDFHHYGCGYYAAPPGVMERIRQLVLAGDKRYLEARDALDRLPAFKIDGDFYKRQRFPDAPEKDRDWLERKSVTALHYSEDTRRLFSKNLAAVVAESFRKLAPVYAFLMHAHETAN